MPRLRSAWRQCAKSYPLSACSLAGRFLGLPMHCRTGGTASISGSRSLLSCRFAFVRRRASGIPLPSTRRCRLLPDLPRSVGFGPIASPPFSPQTMRCRLQPGSSRWRSPYPGGRAAHGAAAPRPQQLANRASAASRSCRSRSPSPWANRPNRCRCAARTRCLPVPCDRQPVDDHPWAEAAAPAGVARPAARARRKPEDLSSTQLNASHPSTQLVL
jgi:hypothetical protein